MVNVNISWNFDAGVQKNNFCFWSDFTWSFFQYLWFPFLCKNNPFYPQLVLYNRKHFCSVFTELSNLSFLFKSKVTFAKLKSEECSLQNSFQKMQKQPFANFLQNRSSYKFPNIHKEIFVTVRGQKTCNFNKKETPVQVFSSEYHKIFKNNFFIEQLWWLLLNMVEEFLIIANF